MANFAKYASLLWQTLSATVRGDFDLVHAHYLMPVAAFALIPAGLRRKPLVITAHGTDIFSGTAWPWRPLIARALRRACRIIVVSEFLAERLAENFGVEPTPGREFVIANMGVNTERFTPGDAAALKQADGHPRRACRTCSSSATSSSRRASSTLRDALVLLRERGVEYRATLLGHGPEMTEVRSIVAPLGDSVRFRTVVSHEALVDVFRSADLFVLPSRREGVGLLVCLESLSCGVPVDRGPGRRPARDRPRRRERASGRPPRTPQPLPTRFSPSSRTRHVARRSLPRLGRARCRTVKPHRPTRSTESTRSVRPADAHLDRHHQLAARAVLRPDHPRPAGCRARGFGHRARLRADGGPARPEGHRLHPHRPASRCEGLGQGARAS